MTQSQILIITGAPRSGTSLVSNIFQAAGVHIGDQLVAPGRGNEHGHFEDVGFFQFHEALLQRLGQSVFPQTPLSLEKISPSETGFAINLIEQRHHHRLWGWKDPRTVLFLNFWDRLVPQARYAFVYRHPLEVVTSILRRATDPNILANPFVGLKAWEIYNQSILDFYEDHPDICVLSHIQTVTVDVEAFLQYTAKKLDLPLASRNTQTLFKPADLQQLSIAPSFIEMLAQIRPTAAEIYARLESVADLPSQSFAEQTGQKVQPASGSTSQTITPHSSSEEAVATNLLSLLTTLTPELMLTSRQAQEKLRVGWMTYATDLEAHRAKLDIDLDQLKGQITTLEARNQNLEENLKQITQTKAWRMAERWYALKRKIKGSKTSVYSRLVSLFPGRFRLWVKFQYQALRLRQLALQTRSNTQIAHHKPVSTENLTILLVYTEMGAPTRYRVINQMTQMELSQLKPICYQTDDLGLVKTLSQADIIYLYRLEATPLTKQVVKFARQQRIPIIFDTDDLIWDPQIETYCYLRDHWPDNEVDDFLASVARHAKIMAEADYFILSTPYLARQATSHFNKKVFVNKNAVSQQAIDLSTPFFKAKFIQPEPNLFDRTTIVYASGWVRAHQEDFGVVVEALSQVLRDRPQVQLKIVGHLELEGLFNGYQERIRFQKFVAWEDLFEALSQSDINLAPIVPNPQRRSKSAVKFLEAALVGVPTVASNLEPYQDIIPGETGFLANSTEEWYRCLLTLIDSPGLRRKMGRTAREHVLNYDTVERRAPHMKHIISEIIEDFYGNA